ncbi:MAG: hypothetical protein CSB15_01215 [Clostridiales bacterium]|nr:MAG: hypothetical protein CSB15_01215 [Clostridiales bacterium]
MRGVSIVLGKELRRIFTDRRLVFNTFILPMLSIFIMYSLMGFFASKMIDNAKNDDIKIIVNHTPKSLSGEFKKFGIKIVSTSDKYDDVKQKLYDKKIDGYLEFDKEFDKKIENYKSGNVPNVKLIYNPKDKKSSMKLNRVKMLFDDFKTNIIVKRLGDKNFANVLNLTRQEVELKKDSEKSVGGFIGMMLPFFLTMFIFSGALGIGIDSIAGEKERGTFAIMLIAPVDRSVIIITKIISIAIVSVLSTISSFVGIILSKPFADSILKNPGMSGVDKAVSNSSFTINQLVMLFVVMMSMTFLFVSLISILSLYAKTVKEANTYVSPIYLVVMMISFLPMYMPGLEAKTFMFAIPIYNAIMCMMKILNGEATALMVLITFISSLAFTFLLIYIMRRMIYKESVVFPS